MKKTISGLDELSNAHGKGIEYLKEKILNEYKTPEPRTVVINNLSVAIMDLKKTMHSFSDSPIFTMDLKNQALDAKMFKVLARGEMLNSKYDSKRYESFKINYEYWAMEYHRIMTVLAKRS